MFLLLLTPSRPHNSPEWKLCIYPAIWLTIRYFEIPTISPIRIPTVLANPTALIVIVPYNLDTVTTFLTSRHMRIDTTIINHKIRKHPHSADHRTNTAYVFFSILYFKYFYALCNVNCLLVSLLTCFTRGVLVTIWKAIFFADSSRN